jgi:hypothetical protein
VPSRFDDDRFTIPQRWGRSNRSAVAAAADMDYVPLGGVGRRRRESSTSDSVVHAVMARGASWAWSRLGAWPGLFGEVAALGHGPFVVGFDHGGGDEPGDRGVVREDADDFGAVLRLGVEAFDTLTTTSTITTSTFDLHHPAGHDLPIPSAEPDRGICRSVPRLRGTSAGSVAQQNLGGRPPRAATRAQST